MPNEKSKNTNVQTWNGMWSRVETVVYVTVLVCAAFVVFAELIASDFELVIQIGNTPAEKSNK